MDRRDSQIGYERGQCQPCDAPVSGLDGIPTMRVRPHMTSNSATAIENHTMDGRGLLAKARRIVVKVGSSSLASIEAGISEEALTQLSDALAARRNQGTEVVVVSSGAIAAGLAPLGLTKRPRDLATQQAAASVGQGLLMARYTQAFGAHGVTVSQVLLTADDLMRRSHHTNAFRALNRLLNLGVVPVVNENDTVATHKIRFGDNDRLSALVAHLVRADAPRVVVRRGRTV